MSYTLSYSGGIITVNDGTLNTETSLPIPGRNFAGYGTYVDQNLISLTQNFAGSTQPINAIAGQLWFDTSVTKLKYNTSPTKGSPTWLEVVGTGPTSNPTFGIVTANTVTANTVTSLSLLNFSTASGNTLTANTITTNGNLTVTGNITGNLLFTQSGSGAITRTQQNKSREWVSVADFGAVGDGIINDASAINNALASLGSAGGTVIIPNGYRCRVSSNIAIPFNCQLQGMKAPIGTINPPNFDSMSCALLLDSGVSITLTNASQISKLLITKYGQQWNRTSTQIASEFTGTAIVLANLSSDIVIEDLTIIGFDYGIRSIAGATNVSRVRIDRVNMDCKNCILLENSYDVCYLREIHCWPFASVNSPAESQNAQLKRSGTAIQLTGINDWTKVTDCFTFGYLTGFGVNAGDSVTFLSCGADYPPITIADGSKGFLIDGDSYEVRIIGGQAAAMDIGVYINVTSTDNKVTVADLNVWEVKSHAIVNERGVAIIDSPVLRNTGAVGNGITTSATSTKTTVTGGSIKGFNVGLSNASTTTPLYYSNIDFASTTTIVLNPYRPTIASADPLPVTGDSQFYEVTGTTNFGTISNPGAYSGKTLVLKFNGILTVIDGVNIRMNGNFVTSADDTLTLVSDGSSYYEVARSAN